MDSNLISKKELLEMYGISYGALYRWKRMGLISEDWFIRRSAPTGQETFFRRELIIPRMDLIQDAYGLHRYPLEELDSVRLVQGEQQTELLQNLKGVFDHD